MQPTLLFQATVSSQTIIDRSASSAEPAHRQRKVVHVDLDAFYASVEQRDNPALKGKPFAVGGAQARDLWPQPATKLATMAFARPCPRSQPSANVRS